METKFLRDGRKVAVICNINAKEFVVQEVFVNEDGVEKLSGDQFVAQNLRDEKLISYHEQQAINAEKRLSDARCEEAKIHLALKKLKLQKEGQAKVVKSNLKMIENLKSFDLDPLADIITGNIKWICYTGTNQWVVPKLFAEGICQNSLSYSSRKFEGLKLMTVFGKGDGDLGYRLNAWSDGSGGNNDVVFFKTDEEMHKFLKKTMYEKSEKGELTATEIKALKKFIDVPKSIINTYIAKEEERFKRHRTQTLSSASIAFDNNMKHLKKSLGEL